jgi:hypothetical protein
MGRPLNPNSDYHRWKALLRAGMRDARHDARHTAATILVVLGVAERTVIGIVGWSRRSMAARYQPSRTRSGMLRQPRWAARCGPDTEAGQDAN